ncbi:hypothetical protein JDV02_003405 [Purpureocillium takamizusanense]|uniref:Efflux pump antibiotic resistance protein n=1 Tax=Purpureocillium takamizusanense TaxID=2060973 RepID=A0A9Q8QDQ1_9HYPO|nr:uncharacterized protein JDV02_003405 [Purpureocillium takamizusanense]UNI17026.1 hypothetical protein JDV02_003405 [Purpureocillium takamizusanense]
MDRTESASTTLRPRFTAPDDSSPATPAQAKPSRPPPILCLGMARTGTASVAAALRILGVGRVHHGLEVYQKEFNYQWRIINRAADATFPVLPTYTGEPFTREQWDEVFGDYDAVTDVASFYAMSLIQAYPDARVVLVERDIERWFESISQVIEAWEDPWNRRMTHLLGPLAGSDTGKASLKFLLGWSESARAEDIRGNARAAYIRHYKDIRAAVPPEQLLDFQFSDGWEPLCRFLGKDIPEVPFPHVNDAAAYAEFMQTTKVDFLQRLAANLSPIALLSALLRFMSHGLWAISKSIARLLGLIGSRS